MLEHMTKIFKRFIEKKIRKVMGISQTWLGFMSGREIIYATFIVCHLQEKKLYFVIIDLEKAFDRVYRGVVRWAMRKPNVDEWVIETVMAMYEFSNSALRINNTMGNKFNVKRGVIHGSVLNPLVFIMVFEALSKKFANVLS